MSFRASRDAPQGTGGEGPPVEPPAGPEESPGGTGGTTAGAPTEPVSGHEIPRTKTALAHNTLIAGAIVLILLLVFILENTENVQISYFGIGFHLPLGVALLLAAIGGALVVGIVGTARIVQLRRRVRRRG